MVSTYDCAWHTMLHIIKKNIKKRFMGILSADYSYYSLIRFDIKNTTLYFRFLNNLSNRLFVNIFRQSGHSDSVYTYTNVFLWHEYLFV